MAVRMEVTSQTFKLEIDYGDEEIDQNDAGTVKDVALAFMESRACEEDDVPDGVIVADKLHTAAITTDDPQRNDVGWKVGKKYAHWGDNLFKDKATKDQLIAILKPIVEGAVETGGSLFKQALKAILCDKLGIVSEIRIQTVASVFKFCWDLFKLALLSYTIEKAFKILGVILSYLIKFLQESQFFSKLKQLGGWEYMQRLIESVAHRPAITQGLKYVAVATVSVVIGGTLVYLFLRKNN